MRKRMGLLFLGFLLFSPTLVFSDCTELGRSTGWAVQGEQRIIYFVGNTPLATVVLQDCSVTGSSNIRILKSYVCDGDTLLVDGQECKIIDLTLGSAP